MRIILTLNILYFELVNEFYNKYINLVILNSKYSYPNANVILSFTI